jgi:hypothetical protein
MVFFLMMPSLLQISDTGIEAMRSFMILDYLDVSKCKNVSAKATASLYSLWGPNGSENRCSQSHHSPFMGHLMSGSSDELLNFNHMELRPSSRAGFPVVRRPRPMLPFMPPPQNPGLRNWRRIADVVGPANPPVVDFVEEVENYHREFREAMRAHLDRAANAPQRDELLEPPAPQGQGFFEQDILFDDEDFEM